MWGSNSIDKHPNMFINTHMLHLFVILHLVSEINSRLFVSLIVVPVFLLATHLFLHLSLLPPLIHHSDHL